MKFVKTSKGYGSLEYTLIIGLIIIIAIILLMWVRNKALMPSWLDKAQGAVDGFIGTGPGGPVGENSDLENNEYYEGLEILISNNMKVMKVEAPEDIEVIEFIKTLQGTPLSLFSYRDYYPSPNPFYLELFKEKNPINSEILQGRLNKVSEIFKDSEMLKKIGEEYVFVIPKDPMIPNNVDFLSMIMDEFLMISQSIIGIYDNEYLFYSPKEEDFSFDPTCRQEGTNCFEIVKTKPNIVNLISVEEDNNYYENIVTFRFKKINEEIYSKDIQLKINTDSKLSNQGTKCKEEVEIILPNGVNIHKFLENFGPLIGDYGDIEGFLILGDDGNIYYSESKTEVSNKLIFNKIEIPEKVKNVEASYLYEGSSPVSVFFIHTVNDNIYEYKNINEIDSLVKQDEFSGNIASLHYGYYNIFIITKNGEVFAKGENPYNSLGIDREGGFFESFEKVIFDEGVKIIDIQSYNDITLFLIENGDVYFAGDFRKKERIPKKIESLSNIKEIKRNEGLSLFISQDNSLFYSGYRYGAIDIDVLSPIKSNIKTEKIKKINFYNGTMGYLVLANNKMYELGLTSDNYGDLKIFYENREAKDIFHISNSGNYYFSALMKNNDIYSYFSPTETIEQKDNLSICLPFVGIRQIGNLYDETFLIETISGKNYILFNKIEINNDDR